MAPLVHKYMYTSPLRGDSTFKQKEGQSAQKSSCRATTLARMCSTLGLLWTRVQNSRKVPPSNSHMASTPPHASTRPKPCRNWQMYVVVSGNSSTSETLPWAYGCKTRHKAAQVGKTTQLRGNDFVKKNGSFHFSFAKFSLRAAAERLPLCPT